MTALKFSERAHRYWLDGKPIPGVTTILGKGLPKPAIPYWAARTVAEYVTDNPDGVEQLRTLGRGPMVAALKGIPWQVRDEAAIRGTEVHALAERLVLGEAVEVPEHVHGHVDGYARWLDTVNLTPLATEAPCYHRAEWYAGTFDLLAEMNGETWLLDVKTSSGIYGNYALQLAAYASAEAMVIDGEDHPIPPVHHIGALHVTDAGTSLHVFRNDDGTTALGHAWKYFRHVKYIVTAIPHIDSWSMNND